MSALADFRRRSTRGLAVSMRMTWEELAARQAETWAKIFALRAPAGLAGCAEADGGVFTLEGAGGRGADNGDGGDDGRRESKQK